LVPGPDAADGHQELNARWLSDSSAAELLNDASCADGSAVTRVMYLLDNPARMTELARNAFQLGAIHRGDGLVTAIHSVALTPVARETMDD
jgi:UDP-N-acetylglucosamine:LPS N-acetylglucosamine transferase